MAEQKPALGLTHNPFTSPKGEFFEGGHRKTYLEQLRHLSQWSRRTLLVTGPRDAGKTVLYRQLSASLEPRAKAARINAALINAPREVLAAIVQGFGLAAPADAPIQLLKDVIIAHVDDQQSHQRFCVVLVDDADLLDGRAVEQLLALVGRCSIRLVLFGDLRIVPVVERAARHLEVSWHELRLSGLNLNDVRAYLEWRFKQARYRGRLPFTEQQVRDIARLSDGMPGRIDQVANVLLAKLQSGEVEPERPGFPVLHRAILVVLAVVLLLVYLLLRSPEETQPADLAEVMRAGADPALSEAEPGESRTATGPAGEGEGPGEPTGSGPAGVPEPLPAAVRVAEPPAEAVAPVSADKPLEASAGASPTSVSDVSPGVSGKAPSPPAPAPPPAAVPVAGSAQTPEPQPSPAKEPAPSGPRSAAWILGQPSDHYTLQLLTSGSKERAAAYVADRKRPGDFAIYRIWRDGKMLYVVIYGAFSSRGEAERAAATPEATAGGVKPWVRPFREVQGAVRSTSQN